MSVAACLVTELNNVTTEDEADWEKSDFVRRFSFDDFKDDVKRQCPCILIYFWLSCFLPFDTLKKSKKSEEYREVETAATAITLKTRRKRVAFPLLISLTLFSRGTNQYHICLICIVSVQVMSNLNAIGISTSYTQAWRYLEGVAAASTTDYSEGQLIVAYDNLNTI